MKRINKNWFVGGLVAVLLLASGCQDDVAIKGTVESHYTEAEKLVIIQSYKEALLEYSEAMVCLEDDRVEQNNAISKGILLFNMGYCYEQLGEYNQAIQSYLESSDEEDTRLLALIALGSVYFQTQDYAKSKVYYEEAIELDTQAYEAYVNLSAIYSLELDDEKALSLLNEAIAIDASKPDAYVNRAYIFARLGNEASMNEDITILKNMNFVGLDVYMKIFNDTLQEVKR